eukprot:153107-Prorocentrum_minimum.AAC.1
MPQSLNNTPLQRQLNTRHSSHRLYISTNSHSYWAYCVAALGSTIFLHLSASPRCVGNGATLAVDRRRSTVIERPHPIVKAPVLPENLRPAQDLLEWVTFRPQPLHQFPVPSIPLARLPGVIVPMRWARGRRIARAVRSCEEGVERCVWPLRRAERS